MLKTEDFTYHLPCGLIAQEPLPQRDHSRLLFLHRRTGKVEHHHFYDLPTLLGPGDFLVLNDTRVLPARLFGHKEGKTGRVEILLLRPCGENRWEIICSPGKRARPGDRLIFGDGRLKGEILQILDSGNRIVSFRTTGSELYPLLDELGEVPLPPYIKKELGDGERYQTVYSRERGSAAAPTAGLHFTPSIFEKLRKGGLEWAFLTLHIGLGTFRPVKTRFVADHHMHSEHYAISATVAKKINEAKKAGRRIIAVGTTCCRVLEAQADEKGFLREGRGETNIFIYPGYQFKAIDGLLTNFHLPRSTLLMLTCALAGRENVLEAYHEAVQLKYRFYSFGDCMLII
ncbi:MAG TPA: tRNA preQ1(34) S-adenosylmethionine ribosyltransferase-isomerase QueA [Firmicutes bacterium]|jgi:S-adenosylmethionine:tRNA ribosyltransferase-isomerase|nr:tRNA preQ1(34) S-adenosylmethionine ribosyltransferase-isomerase QueA [Bacillota bacterium]